MLQGAAERHRKAIRAMKARPPPAIRVEANRCAARRRDHAWGGGGGWRPRWKGQIKWTGGPERPRRGCCSLALRGSGVITTAATRPDPAARTYAAPPGEDGSRPARGRPPAPAPANLVATLGWSGSIWRRGAASLVVCGARRTAAPPAKCAARAGGAPRAKGAGAPAAARGARGRGSVPCGMHRDWRFGSSFRGHEGSTYEG
ncbi:MAG: hypothetical protein J3K34DRAFT_399277 [Monoraphidium minutum]|nr:MAG: hypothetical protein J3K34DRAFT_399277 [Monoraphidium minutum]